MNRDPDDDVPVPEPTPPVNDPNQTPPPPSKPPTIPPDEDDDSTPPPIRLPGREGGMKEIV